MKAVTYRGVESVRVDEVPEPVIQSPTDAIVAVEVAGVCGSDLHVYHGRETGLDVGTVLGHELAGRVIAVGDAVADLAVGDRVVSPFTTSCGTCFFCLRGHTCRCERGELLGWVEAGRGLHGAQAERTRVPLADGTLVHVPDDLPLEVALFAGDVLTTGYFGALSAGVEAGSVAVVIGCGPVGLMAALSAKELGAAAVVAVDMIPERLDLAERFGAEPVALAGGAPRRAVDRATAGRGADCVIEAVGSPAALRLALDLVRPGGCVASVGVHTSQQLPLSPVEAYDKNLTLRFGRCPARHHADRALEIASRRRDDVAAVISHRLPLEDATAAYALFAGRRDGCTKVVLLP